MSIFQTLCYVEIETVSACTRSCPWCLFGAYPDFRPEQVQYLDTEVIYKIFRSLKRNGFRGMIALFSINEPLLDERIRGGRLISDCKRIFDGQVLVGLTTNGDRLSPASAELLFRSGLDQLKISCYSDAEYQTMRELYGGDARITVIDQTHFCRNEFESNRAGSIKGSSRSLCSYDSCSSPYYRAAIGWDGEVRICLNDILQQVKIGKVYSANIQLERAPARSSCACDILT
jgi:hypothetical protein